MVVHTCNRCLKDFDRKDNYDRHLNKKNICKLNIKEVSQKLELVNTNICVYCVKTYSNIYKLNRHLTICKIKLNNELNNKILNLEEKINILESEKNNTNVLTASISKQTLETNNNIICCKYCNKKFKRKDYLKKHLDIACKLKKEKEVENNIMMKKITNLEEKINILETKKPGKANISNTNITINQTNNEIVEKKLQTTNNITKITDTNSNPINEQLFNIIVKKDKKIEELNTNKNKLINIIDDEKEENNYKLNTITLNNIVIQSRKEDNYINASQLCQAGNKNFSDWISLDSTKELIKVIENDTSISASQLIDNNWLHPDLAGLLAQWISPIFALQVSKWIRTLFMISNVDIELKTKDKKIKLLENLCVKKHKRQEYPGKYVIYMLTTEDHKKNGIYIIGKATDLKDRLGTYNKTCVHEVVYYKECKNEEEMDLIEKNVLLKLSKYKEVANRDRFILPIENDISLFTNSIDNAIKFFD